MWTGNSGRAVLDPLRHARVRIDPHHVRRDVLSPGEGDQHGLRFGILTEQSLSQADSVKLILQTAKDYG